MIHLFYYSGGTIMNLTAARPSLSKSITGIKVQSGAVYALIIILAMIAFEVFNYSTTAFSLQDLLGDLKFAGIPWSTFLALAFCGIDFAGVAKLIAPDNRRMEIKESWYLFGAWLIAATANAALTWWGVSVAISSHALKSSSIIDSETLTRTVPLFVAIMVWVLRILIIASLTSALERLTGKGKAADRSGFAVNYSSEDSSNRSSSPSRPVSGITMTRINNPVTSNASRTSRTNTGTYVSFKDNVQHRSKF
jgi:hypothetical protein